MLLPLVLAAVADAATAVASVAGAVVTAAAVLSMSRTAHTNLEIDSYTTRRGRLQPRRDTILCSDKEIPKIYFTADGVCTQRYEAIDCF